MGGSSKFSGGVFFGGGSSKFSGGGIFLGGVPPNFRRWVFFLGGFLQIFGGGYFWGGCSRFCSNFSGGGLHRNTVNVRPVRILLECILVVLVDLDECTNEPCWQNSYCQNTDGGYNCVCFTGYEQLEPNSCGGKWMSPWP